MELELQATSRLSPGFLHPQLADAALIYLAGREGIDTIFTLDRRDLAVYRSARNRPFRILP